MRPFTLSRRAIAAVAAAAMTLASPVLGDRPVVDSIHFLIPGGGGGKAIGDLIENAESNHGTLMVNSTPIVIRSLTGVFPQRFRNLALIARTIGDYAVIVVSADSDILNLDDPVTAVGEDPGGFSVGGGSVPGGAWIISSPRWSGRKLGWIRSP